MPVRTTSAFGFPSDTPQGQSPADRVHARGTRARAGTEPGTTTGTPRAGRPPRLRVDPDGLLRLDRRSLYAQVLLRLSQDDTAPTKAQQLTSQLAATWSGPAVFNALRDLVTHAFAARVGRAMYVRLWAPLPAVH